MADCVLVRSPAHARYQTHGGWVSAREGRKKNEREPNKNVKRDSPRAFSGVCEDAVRMCAVRTEYE